MTEISIYEQTDYRDFLGSLPPKGLRARLATAARCQMSYVSRVLSGRADFSLEQADAITAYLGLSAAEAEYFLLLVEYSRAGTASLKRYFLRKLESLRDQQLVIRDRLESRRSMSREDQMTYYSSWLYAAVHMLVSLENRQSRESLAEALKVPLIRISEVLEFLVSAGFVQKEGERFVLGREKIHLERDSPMISKHHANWRLRALEALDRPPGSGLHYSVLVGISEEDCRRISARCVEFIAEIMKIVDASPQQGIHSLCMDFFRVS